MVVRPDRTGRRKDRAEEYGQRTPHGTGLLPGDVIIGVSKPTAQAGLGIGGFRNDPLVADKFYITFVNPTAGTVTPTASETYQITVARPIPGSSAISSVV